MATSGPGWWRPALLSGLQVWILTKQHPAVRAASGTERAVLPSPSSPRRAPVACLPPPPGHGVLSEHPPLLLSLLPGEHTRRASSRHRPRRCPRRCPRPAQTHTRVPDSLMKSKPGAWPPVHGLGSTATGEAGIAWKLPPCCRTHWSLQSCLPRHVLTAPTSLFIRESPGRGQWVRPTGCPAGVAGPVRSARHRPTPLDVGAGTRRAHADTEPSIRAATATPQSSHSTESRPAGREQSGHQEERAPVPTTETAAIGKAGATGGQPL